MPPAGVRPQNRRLPLIRLVEPADCSQAIAVSKHGDEDSPVRQIKRITPVYHSSVTAEAQRYSVRQLQGFVWVQGLRVDVVGLNRPTYTPTHSAGLLVPVTDQERPLSLTRYRGHHSSPAASACTVCTISTPSLTVAVTPSSADNSPRDVRGRRVPADEPLSRHFSHIRLSSLFLSGRFLDCRTRSIDCCCRSRSFGLAFVLPDGCCCREFCCGEFWLIGYFLRSSGFRFYVVWVRSFDYLGFTVTALIFQGAVQVDPVATPAPPLMLIPMRTDTTIHETPPREATARSPSFSAMFMKAASASTGDIGASLPGRGRRSWWG